MMIERKIASWIGKENQVAIPADILRDLVVNKPYRIGSGPVYENGDQWFFLYELPIKPFLNNPPGETFNLNYSSKYNPRRARMHRMYHDKARR